MPAAEGLLICSALRADTGKGQRFIFAGARTWIAANMAQPDQTPIAAAPSGVESQLTIMTMMALERAQED
jgi:hypothetical protein